MKPKQTQLVLQSNVIAVHRLVELVKTLKQMFSLRRSLPSSETKGSGHTLCLCGGICTEITRIRVKHRMGNFQISNFLILGLWLE